MREGEEGRGGQEVARGNVTAEHGEKKNSTRDPLSRATTVSRVPFSLFHPLPPLALLNGRRRRPLRRRLRLLRGARRRGVPAPPRTPVRRSLCGCAIVVPVVARPPPRRGLLRDRRPRPPPPPTPCRARRWSTCCRRASRAARAARPGADGVGACGDVDRGAAPGCRAPRRPVAAVTTPSPAPSFFPPT